MSHIWQYTSVIPVVCRERKEDGCEFQVSLGYKARPSLTNTQLNSGAEEIIQWVFATQTGCL